MASRFWVGGTGTWDASDTTHWSATTGGAGGQSVPGSGDTVTFDGSSGGGTVTVNATINVTSITMGAFTGTLDFATNNNNVTVQSFSGSGTGARTLNMGNGTWTVTSTSGNVWDCGTVTSFTLNANSSTIDLATTPAGSRTFVGGGKTYNNLSITNASASSFRMSIAGANTFNNFTATNVRFLQFSGSVTYTINGTFTYDGLSTSVGSLTSDGLGVTTLAVAGANTLSWLFVQNITKSGAGSITVNNGLNGGANTSVTINAPSSGSGARVIGG